MALRSSNSELIIIWDKLCRMVVRICKDTGAHTARASTHVTHTSDKITMDATKNVLSLYARCAHKNVNSLIARRAHKTPAHILPRIVRLPTTKLCSPVGGPFSALFDFLVDLRVVLGLLHEVAFAESSNLGAIEVRILGHHLVEKFAVLRVEMALIAVVLSL